MFTVEERDRARDRLVEMACADDRIVACALIGSLARDGGDRWSDLDLGFGVAVGASMEQVLADWTARLEREHGAARLFDLPVGKAIYRVFLLPGNLQVDLSFAPESEFVARGPDFKLVFGDGVEGKRPPPPCPAHLFGLGAHHAVRARVSIERGRWWQAEYWISGVRDQALSLACLQRGLDTRHGRGFDELPADTLALGQGALARSLSRDELVRALGCAVELLLDEAGDLASAVDARLRELA